MTFHRFCAGELRVVPDGDRRRIVGYAAVYNSLSHDLGGFREQIAPGAFREALAADADTLALIDHDTSLIIGRRSRGTLRLQEDSRGLLAEIDVPDTTAGKDLIVSVERGDKCGMSFYLPRNSKDAWKAQPDGTAIRTILSVPVLREVTVTGIPAYPGTCVAVRAMDADDAAAAAYYAEQIRKLNGGMDTHVARRFIDML